MGGDSVPTYHRKRHGSRFELRRPRWVANIDRQIPSNFHPTAMNDSTDGVLLALMARLIRIESMVCSLSILCMKHMSEDNVDEYRALAKWVGAMRDRIIETSVESSAEQFPELAKFLEEHVELSERDLTEMFQQSRNREQN
jgi:hypothetical protein